MDENAPEVEMILTLRRRVALAATSLLAVASVAAVAVPPAGGAPINSSVTLTDQPNDPTPTPLGAADITTSTATYKPTDVVFTLATQAPEDPRKITNWSFSRTAVRWLVRTTTAAPGYDYEVRSQYFNGNFNGHVYAATDTAYTNPLCPTLTAAYSSQAHRASIDAACIGRPDSLTFAPALDYQTDAANPDSVVRDGPDNGAFSGAITRPKLGYWLVGRDGGIFAFGQAAFSGSTGGMHLNKPIVGMASDPDGKGYWFVASDGGIFAYDAGFFGSTGDKKLNSPIVGMAPTPTGLGYWLVAADGGIFAFGDAKFRGSTGDKKLNKPIVGMAAAPNGRGYWLVASDGGVFAFGNGADFFGSTGDIKLAQPIVGMAAAPNNKGYWFVAADGGIFNFGDGAGFYETKLGGAPVTGMAAAPDGRGYWITRADGAVNGFGSAANLGGLTQKPASPVIGIAALDLPASEKPAPTP